MADAVTHEVTSAQRVQVVVHPDEQFDRFRRSAIIEGVLVSAVDAGQHDQIMFHRAQEVVAGADAGDQPDIER